MRIHLSRELIAVMRRPESGMLRSMIKIIATESTPGWASPIKDRLGAYEFYVPGYRIQYVIEQDRDGKIIRMAIVDQSASSVHRPPSTN